MKNFHETNKINFAVQNEFIGDILILLKKYDRTVTAQLDFIGSVANFVTEDFKYLESRAEKAK